VLDLAKYRTRGNYLAAGAGADGPVVAIVPVLDTVAVGLDPEGIVPGVIAPDVNEEPIGASTHPVIEREASAMAANAIMLFTAVTNTRARDPRSRLRQAIKPAARRAELYSLEYPFKAHAFNSFLMPTVPDF
jgi:hypothetical protein